MDDLLLPIHIGAGGVCIITGYTALLAGKGSAVHRKSGLVFVFAMVVMSVLGAIIAGLRGQEASTIGGLLVPYLVLTSLATVRPLGERWRWLGAAGLAAAASVGLYSTALGIQAVQLGGVREGIPAAVLFMFTAVCVLAGAGDIRVMRSGPLTGAPRLARHLWRMCYSLWIATGSFFLGQADEFPVWLQHPAFYVPPAVAPLIALVFWMWRVRFKRSLRGIASVRVSEPAVQRLSQ